MFEKLTIIAPGLLGASIAMAAKERKIANDVSVWARREETRRQLDSKDWCDAAPDTIEAACKDSECIILCAPVERIIDLAKQIAPELNSNPIVTDVGSVKSKIVRESSYALKDTARFVGSHPMAGSEKTGMENADAGLFDGRTCFVTPFENTDEIAADKIATFWQALGSIVLRETPEKHDEIVSKVSHLPHILASALASYLLADQSNAKDTCGNGLKDTTRVAAGDPALWKEIIVQNREEILRSLSDFQDRLQLYYSAIANEDYLEIMKRLNEGKAFRDALD